MTDRPKIIAIAAVALDGTIGVGNKIPWYIPEDFKHFRKTTMGSVIIVGSVTFHILPEKAFEGREYIVLNNGDRFENERKNVYQFSTIDLVMMLLTNLHTDKVFVAGGAGIYSAMIDYCDEAMITWVDLKPNGDKKFPVGKLGDDFQITDETDWMSSKTGVEYCISHYMRIPGWIQK